VGSLLAETIPLALAGAVSPILFVEVLAVISGPQRLRRGLAFAAGATIPLIAVATLVLLAGDAVSLPKSPTATAVIDIVLGAALLAFGASALFHAPRHKEAGAGRQPSRRAGCVDPRADGAARLPPRSRPRPADRARGRLRRLAAREGDRRAVVGRGASGARLRNRPTIGAAGP